GVFLLRLGAVLAFGGDADGVSLDDAADALDSDHAFHFFSLQAMLAFIMGFGWAGLAGRLEWGLGPVLGIAAGLGGGVAMTLLEVVLAYQIRKLQSSGNYDVRTAVGKTGRCYLTIPPHGQGTGQVQVVVSGRQKILTAASSGPGIAAFEE